MDVKYYFGRQRGKKIEVRDEPAFKEKKSFSWFKKQNGSSFSFICF